MENVAPRGIREVALRSPATTCLASSLAADHCCGGRKLGPDGYLLVGADLLAAFGLDQN